MASTPRTLTAADGWITDETELALIGPNEAEITLLPDVAPSKKSPTACWVWSGADGDAGPARKPAPETEIGTSALASDAQVRSEDAVAGTLMYSDALQAVTFLHTLTLAPIVVEYVPPAQLMHVVDDDAPKFVE